jgi:nicotinate-nucleotide adenylyltransferase
MISAARLGILGGTFDPVHTGHVDTAVAARDALALERVVLMPSHIPPHRPVQPVASAYHRFAMAALAVNGIEGLEAWDMELGTPGPTYTADTLGRLHAEGLRPSQIFFITGADAFAEIATWSRYPRVLDMAHFVVVSRPGYLVGELAGKLPSLATRLQPARRNGGQAENLTVYLLDARTPDVSSTDLRRRLAANESVRGLVPAAVETHITQHHLYSRHKPTPLIPTADHLHGQD